jgi:hypothetical protein
MGLFLIW